MMTFWIIIKKILNLLLDTVLLYLSMIVPRNRNILLFGAWFGKKYDDNSKAIYEYILVHYPEIKAFWITTDRVIYKTLKSQNKPVCFSGSFHSIYLTFRAKGLVCVTGTNDIGWRLSRLLGNANIFELWHGVPLKKILYDNKVYIKPHSKLANIRKKLERFPYRKVYVFCTSENFHKIYQSAFRLPPNHIFNLGQARNDIFYSQRTNSIREKYQGKRVIVYMPTHRLEGNKKMNMNKILDLKKINELCLKNNCVFLIKKHYYHKEEKELNIDCYSNIIDITNLTIYTNELLLATDILITDYSSCFIDFLLLDRPILFYAYDIDDYQINDRDFYQDYYSNVPGKICETCEDLCLQLLELLSEKDNYIIKREEQRNFYYSVENQCEVSAKQATVILNL